MAVGLHNNYNAQTQAKKKPFGIGLCESMWFHKMHYVHGQQCLWAESETCHMTLSLHNHKQWFTGLRTHINIVFFHKYDELNISKEIYKIYRVSHKSLIILDFNFWVTNCLQLQGMSNTLPGWVMVKSEWKSEWVLVDISHDLQSSL